MGYLYSICDHRTLYVHYIDLKIAYDAKTFQLRSQWEQAGHASAPVHLDQSQDKTHFLTNRRAAIVVNDGL